MNKKKNRKSSSSSFSDYRDGLLVFGLLLVIAIIREVFSALVSAITNVLHFPHNIAVLIAIIVLILFISVVFKCWRRSVKKRSKRAKNKSDTPVVSTPPKYLNEVSNVETVEPPPNTPPDGWDPLLFDAADIVLSANMPSTSYLQRRLKLGYARAARLLDQMEEVGLVGPFEGSSPRKILVSKEQWVEMKKKIEPQSDIDDHPEPIKDANHTETAKHTTVILGRALDSYHRAMVSCGDIEDDGRNPRFYEAVGYTVAQGVITAAALQDVFTMSSTEAEGVIALMKKEGYIRDYDGFGTYLANINDDEWFEKANAISNSYKLKGQALDFDKMEGHQFETYCADVLRGNGFSNVRVTQGSGDQGVDILAEKEGVKYAIQCKCYSSDVGNKAVQEVFSGKNFYDCHVAVVLTNQHFTASAQELAQKTGVLLWERETLERFVRTASEQ
ncbi:MAG: restriction endonuclease [Clostridiales bacterium]|nr:restriction endonuclease [Clostridiales bacterium]